MRTLWRIIARTLFWDYDRGTVPYDLMVLAVVLFVFLTPRAWFNDRPQSAGSVAAEPHVAEVQKLTEDAAGARTYRIDAHLLAPTKPDPQWERRTHDFLSKNVPELKGRTFQIVRVEAARSGDGTVLYYDVFIK